MSHSSLSLSLSLFESSIFLVSDGSISPPKPTSHLPAKRTRSFPVCMTTKEVSTPVIDFDEAEAERCGVLTPFNFHSFSLS